MASYADDVKPRLKPLDDIAEGLYLRGAPAEGMTEFSKLLTLPAEERGKDHLFEVGYWLFSNVIVAADGSFLTDLDSPEAVREKVDVVVLSGVIEVAAETFFPTRPGTADEGTGADPVAEGEGR